jgi:hypothetical protein
MISTIKLFRRRAGLFVFAAGAIIFANASARAAEEYYVFKSVLSTPNASWCIDVPQYQAASHTVVSACSGQANQTFGYESGGSLTNGGYCLDALPANPNQPPSAGDPIVIAECNGSDPQVWQLQPFKSRSDAFAIVNPDGFCVSVDGPIGEGTQLVLAQCAEQDNQAG